MKEIQPVLYDDANNKQKYLRHQSSCKTADFANNNSLGVPAMENFFTDTTFAVTSLAINKSSDAFLQATSLVHTKEDIVSQSRKEWAWLKTCHECTSTHLDHSAAYHDFFLIVADCNKALTDIHCHLNTTFLSSDMRGDAIDLKDILSEMREILSSYLQLQTRIELVYDVSKTIYPLELRHITLTRPREGRMLCDYNTDAVDLKTDDTVMIVDNSETIWKVQTKEGHDVKVPSLAVVIPPPSNHAHDASLRLLRQLAVTWHTSVKRLSHHIVSYLLLIFRDFEEKEVTALQDVSSDLRNDVLDVSDTIKALLQQYCESDPDFEELQMRLARLRFILEDDGEHSDKDSTNGSSMSVVVQTNLLKTLLNRYKDFVDFWAVFNDSVKDRTPLNIFVLPDSANYCISYAYLSRYMDVHVEGEHVPEMGTVVMNEIPEVPFDRAASSKVQVTTSAETSETDQIVTSVEEDQATYMIDGVWNPYLNDFISLEEAVEEGLYNDDTGVYTNPLTGVQLNTSQALNSGKIIVQIKENKKIREEQSTIGLVLIKTTTETRPYEIIDILDPYSSDRVTVVEAIDCGFYNEEAGEYISHDGSRISVKDAIEKGIITVQYGSEDDEECESKETVRTYAIHGVVDQLNHKTISYSDAIDLQIINKVTGSYYHNVKGEFIPVNDAMKKGFIKARVVEDNEGLNIDPKNTIVINRFQRAKDKLKIFSTLGKKSLKT